MIYWLDVFVRFIFHKFQILWVYKTFRCSSSMSVCFYIHYNVTLTASVTKIQYNHEIMIFSVFNRAVITSSSRGPSEFFHYVRCKKLLFYVHTVLEAQQLIFLTLLSSLSPVYLGCKKAGPPSPIQTTYLIVIIIIIIIIIIITIIIIIVVVVIIIILSLL